MHLMEKIILTRLTKIINSLLKDLKILIFSLLKIGRIFPEKIIFFSLDAYVVSWPTLTKILERFLLSGRGNCKELENCCFCLQ